MDDSSVRTPERAAARMAEPRHECSSRRDAEPAPDPRSFAETIADFGSVNTHMVHDFAACSATFGISLLMAWRARATTHRYVAQQPYPRIVRRPSSSAA